MLWYCLGNRRGGRKAAGVVALGESPADRSGQAPLIPNYVRVEASAKCYSSKKKRGRGVWDTDGNSRPRPFPLAFVFYLPENDSSKGSSPLIGLPYVTSPAA